ncbi:MAG: DUF3343 domain-containing protein [Clostridia bacterium]|nr:DUF3343 domain-containing protein [Clostridia bacterium]
MNRYIATFYTHLSAITTLRSLEKVGIEAALGPVPRRLSSSCGVCLRFEAQEPPLNLLDEDYEGLYLCEGQEYRPIVRQE